MYDDYGNQSAGQNNINKRPTSRKKHVSGKGKPVKKTGEGLGTGPVGRNYLEKSTGSIFDNN